MKPFPLPLPWPGVLALLAAMLVLAPQTGHAAVLEARHELQASLLPLEQLLRCKDRISLQLQDARSISLRLDEDAVITRCAMQGEEAAFERRAGWLMLDTPPGLQDGEVLLELDYEARYDDPLPDDPVNFDNPGFGVQGVIAPQGALLLAGSGWHPTVTARAQSFSLRVTAPAGMFAVTAGSLVSLHEQDGRAVSVWEVARILEDLPLVAGAYLVEESRAELPEGGEAPVQTFFSRANQDLSQRYLQAAARYVGFYSSLHGEYAFDKFAVVENFFPTGYGFPSFTLLGGRVLRLPFIPHTSLRHEVAHCWWGNGVLVNYGEGNWCEGLTTYVADYLAKEEESGAAARDYRLRVLRDYALLVGDGPAPPLARFISRTSPQSRAIGYGKAMFVFHMLRRMVGDAHFWDALRALYADKLFQKASWSDILDVFVRQGGLTPSAAGCFFKQWVQWSQVPKLRLEDVRLSNDATGWRVRGTIRQDEPAFCMRLPLLLEAPGGDVEKVLAFTTAAKDFTLLSRTRPTALQVDPEADIFRLLEPGEIPATVNSVKGSRALRAVLATGQPRERARLLERLLLGLSQPDVPVLLEEELDAATLEKMAGHDLLLLGYPRSQELQRLLPPMPEGLKLGPGAFGLEFAPGVSRQADTLFATLTRKQDNAGSVVALLVPRKETEDEAVEAALRKITHYGSYGCLAFDKGANLLKHRWPPASSPLRVVFPEGTNQDSAALGRQVAGEDAS